MEEQILQKIEEQGKKIDDLLQTVNKLRRYFLAIIWITVILFVLPLIAAVFVVPAFLDTYLSSFDGLL
ncbi:hypothetical protein IIB50_02650 [Patescibacteria group bacterium]|nr:hypothetical protein [Patescibacteria group bacterium]